MQMWKGFCALVVVACAGCAHAAPAAQTGAPHAYDVEVENATGTAITLGYCGLRICGRLGHLAPGETGRFSVDPGETEAITLFGMDGDRWVARQRADLRDAHQRRVSLTPLTP